MAKTDVKCLFHKDTSTCTFIVSCSETGKAMVIDSVMDYNPANGRTSFEHNEEVAKYCTESKLDVEWICETHVHADHLTGAYELKKTHFPSAKTAIGFNVTEVQETFKSIFNFKDEDFKCDGSQFDHLFRNGEEWTLGKLNCRAFWTPGHTPACMTYLVGDAVFTGDTIFMPDMGSARCDFPKGSADALYASIQKLFELPDETRVFVGHDYQPGGREVAWESTIGEEKTTNKHINAKTDKESFVQWRRERDSGLGAPRLLLPALQVNLRNGILPPPEDNGTSYIKIPLNTV